MQIRLPRRHVSTESQGRSRSQGHLPSHCSVKHLAWLTNLVIDSCDTRMSCRPVCVDSVVKLSSHLQVVSCWTVAQLQLCVFSVWCHLLTYSLTSQSLWSLCTFTMLTHDTGSLVNKQMLLPIFHQVLANVQFHLTAAWRWLYNELIVEDLSTSNASLHYIVKCSNSLQQMSV